MQPFLLVFVFTFVFPKIGQGVGGAGNGGPAAAAFATLLVAGVVGVTILFQGIQSVALPMVQEFGYTKEIEDRVLAPLPVSMVALAKVTSGAIQGLIAALIVFPIAAVVPANPVHLHVNWPVLLTLAPLACITASALGLTFGTRFEPRTVPLMFGVVVIPLTFLGVRLLLLDGARADQGGRVLVAQVPGADQPARLHVRGLPRRSHHGPPHVARGCVSGARGIRGPLPLPGDQRVQEAGSQLMEPGRSLSRAR